MTIPGKAKMNIAANICEGSVDRKSFQEGKAGGLTGYLKRKYNPRVAAKPKINAAIHQ